MQLNDTSTQAGAIRPLRCVWLLCKLKLTHQMNFRFSFFGGFFVDGTMFLLQLLAFNAIYGATGGIGGWSQGEMILFLGTGSLINALNMVLYFFGVNTLPDKILSGSLDLYLSKPVSPLLRVTFENVDLGSLPLVGLSVLILLYGASLLPAPVAPGTVLLYVLFVLLMTLLWYDLEVIVRTLPFYFLTAGGAQDLEGSLLELCLKVPGVWFQGFFKILFYFVLPYGVMMTLPTQVLAGTLEPVGMLFGAGIVALFTALTALCWKLGLRHYKSPGN